MADNIIEQLSDELAHGDFSTRAAKVPSIPTPTQELAQLVKSVAAIKQLLDIREATASSVLDKSITLRDLIDSGVMAITLGTVVLGAPPSTSVTIPVAGPPSEDDIGYHDPRPVLSSAPTPTDLTATGTFRTVFLDWDLIEYQNHSHTQIWRSGTNVIGTAVMIGTARGNLYADPTAAVGVSYYYWVRAVALDPDDGSSMVGAYNAVGGTLGGPQVIGGTDLGPLIVEAGNLATHAVTSVKIEDDAITAPKIAANAIAVGTAAIQNGAIVNAMIANLAVDTAKIVDASITNAKIGDAAITNAKIDDATITHGKIITLDATKITVGTLSSSRIAAGSIDATKLSVTDLSAINADMGTITAGSITMSGSGNFIRGGATGYAIGTGFFLGWSATGTPGYKFSIGSSTNYLRWDGSTITFSGALSAATGSFSGSLSAATGSFAGSLSAATGTFAGTLTAAAVNAVDSINIAGDAVTVPRFSSASASVLLDAVTWTTLLTTVGVNPTAAGKIAMTVTIKDTPGTTVITSEGSTTVTEDANTYRIRRNGTTTVATFQGAAYTFSDAPGNATTTYTVEGLSGAFGGDGAAGSVTYRTVLNIGMKR